MCPAEGLYDDRDNLLHALEPGQILAHAFPPRGGPVQGPVLTPRTPHQVYPPEWMYEDAAGLFQLVWNRCPGVPLPPYWTGGPPPSKSRFSTMSKTLRAPNVLPKYVLRILRKRPSGCTKMWRDSSSWSGIAARALLSHLTGQVLNPNRERGLYIQSGPNSLDYLHDLVDRSRAMAV